MNPNLKQLALAAGLLAALGAAIAVQRYESRQAAAKVAGIGGSFAQADSADAAATEDLADRNEALERQIEAEIWDSPRELRRQRADASAKLLRDQATRAQRQREIDPSGDPALDYSIRLKQADVARIDARLRALHARAAPGHPR